MGTSRRNESILYRSSLKNVCMSCSFERYRAITWKMRREANQTRVSLVISLMKLCKLYPEFGASS